MTPRMSVAELRLFESFIKCSDNYVEFGAGGSTCLAAAAVTTSVKSTDSSQEWLAAVSHYCVENATKIKPELNYVDIGPTGDWGYPTDPASRNRWNSYHGKIWQDPDAASADLYMVDGRFRVACFIQVLLHCEIDAVIMIHDFRSRPEYQIIREVAQEIACAEDLSVFKVPLRKFRSRARAILQKFEFVAN